MKFYLLGLAGSLVIASCVTTPKVVNTEKRSGDALRDKFTGGYTYSKSGGMMKSKSDKQSSFAGKKFTGTNDFGGKKYSTKDYASKRWGGNTAYNSKRYAGNTDGSRYKYAPSYANNKSGFEGAKANANGKAFGTNNFATSNASESSGRRFANKANQYAKRNNLERDPIIMSKRDRAKMSVDETNSLLGRSSSSFGN